MDAAKEKLEAFTVLGLPSKQFGVAHLIVTAVREPEGVGHYEYYLLSSRLTPHLFYDQQTMDEAEFREKNYIETFEEILLHEARESARHVLYTKLEELRETNRLSQDVVSNIEFEDAELIKIKHVYRASLSDHLKEIRNSTHCSELKLGLVTA